MRSSRVSIAMTVVAIAAICACGVNGPEPVSPEEARAIAKEKLKWNF